MQKKLIYTGIVLLVTILVFVFISINRGPNIPEPPFINGTIYEIEGSRILVAEEFIEIDEEEHQGISGNAIWANVTEKTNIVRGLRSIGIASLNVGDGVRIWTEGELLSTYPVEGNALRILVTERK